VTAFVGSTFLTGAVTVFEAVTGAVLAPFLVSTALTGATVLPVVLVSAFFGSTLVSSGLSAYFYLNLAINLW